jgi:hypothetical protein
MCGAELDAKICGTEQGATSVASSSRQRKRVPQLGAMAYGVEQRVQNQD